MIGLSVLEKSGYSWYDVSYWQICERKQCLHLLPSTTYIWLIIATLYTPSYNLNNMNMIIPIKQAKNRDFLFTF